MICVVARLLEVAPGEEVSMSEAEESEADGGTTVGAGGGGAKQGGGGAAQAGGDPHTDTSGDQSEPSAALSSATMLGNSPRLPPCSPSHLTSNSKASAGLLGSSGYIPAIVNTVGVFGDDVNDVILPEAELIRPISLVVVKAAAVLGL